MLRCVSGTPFGGPVDPDVYIIQHKSYSFGLTMSVGLLLPSCWSSSRLIIMRCGCASFSVEISEFSTVRSLFQTTNLMSWATFKGPRRVGSRTGSTKISFACVWSRL